MFEINKVYNTDKNYTVIINNKYADGSFSGSCLGPNGSYLNSTFDKNGVSNSEFIGKITSESLAIDYLKPSPYSWCSF